MGLSLLEILVLIISSLLVGIEILSMSIIGPFLAGILVVSRVLLHVASLALPVVVVLLLIWNLVVVTSLLHFLLLFSDYKFLVGDILLLEF